MLLKQGVNPKIVQERLGHSSIDITMYIYSHVMPNMQRDAIANFNIDISTESCLLGLANYPFVI